MIRVVAGTLLLVLVGAACTGGSVSFDSVEDYGDRVAEISSRFGERAESDPAGGELLMATLVFAAYEDAYDALAAIDPPAALDEPHRAFVDAFAAVQRHAAQYLGEGGMSGDFSMDDLNSNAEFTRAFGTMMRACGDLRLALVREMDGPIPDTCGYAG